MTNEYEQTEQEKEEKLKAYFETKTPTFLKIKDQYTGYKVLNGFIESINDTYILFRDIKLNNFPVLKSDILKVAISKKAELINGGNPNGKL